MYLENEDYHYIQMSLLSFKHFTICYLLSWIPNVLSNVGRLYAMRSTNKFIGIFCKLNTREIIVITVAINPWNKLPNAITMMSSYLVNDWSHTFYKNITSSMIILYWGYSFHPWLAVALTYRIFIDHDSLFIFKEHIFFIVGLFYLCNYCETTCTEFFHNPVLINIYQETCLQDFLVILMRELQNYKDISKKCLLISISLLSL